MSGFDIPLLAGSVVGEVVRVIIEAVRGTEPPDEPTLRRMVAEALRDHTKGWLAEARREADRAYESEGGDA